MGVASGGPGRRGARRAGGRSLPANMGHEVQEMCVPGRMTSTAQARGRVPTVGLAWPGSGEAGQTFPSGTQFMGHQNSAVGTNYFKAEF